MRKTVAQLENEMTQLEYERDQILAKLKVVEDHRKSILDIFNIDLQAYGFPLILKKLRAIKEVHDRVDTGSELVDYHVKNENSKLWYLLRTMVHDQTLIQSREDHADFRNPNNMSASPFAKPKF